MTDKKAQVTVGSQFATKNRGWRKIQFSRKY
uniref:Uncharacterized protein n=1 Tax=Tetraselmis sp. GSL018 TaxID=582737 RepID=A0A061QNC5_9CHLO